MADRLSNGFGFGQGFGQNGLDAGQIGGIPNVDQTPQWAAFSQNHGMNPGMNPQVMFFYACHTLLLTLV